MFVTNLEMVNSVKLSFFRQLTREHLDQILVTIMDISFLTTMKLCLLQVRIVKNVSGDMKIGVKLTR